MENIERELNISPEAPVAGVYRYELIPAAGGNCYVDIWYQFAMGMDEAALLEFIEDSFYLNEGDRIAINDIGLPYVKVKQKPLRLVVNNG